MKKTDNQKWIKWNGGKCPVSLGDLIITKHRKGSPPKQTKITKSMLDNAVWEHVGGDADIIAYRHIKTDPVTPFAVGEEVRLLDPKAIKVHGKKKRTVECIMIDKNGFHYLLSDIKEVVKIEGMEDCLAAPGFSEKQIISEHDYNYDKTISRLCRLARKTSNNLTTDKAKAKAKPATKKSAFAVKNNGNKTIAGAIKANAKSAKKAPTKRK